MWGQWDSIKEKMVWESMEKNKGLPGMDGAVMEGLHVGQAAKTSVLLGSKKGAHVDDEGAVFGHMHDKVILGNKIIPSCAGRELTEPKMF
jgi:hypothetical protein